MKPTLLVLLLLTTGCVTLAPLVGQDGAPGLRAVSALREIGGDAPLPHHPAWLASTEPGETMPAGIHSAEQSRGAAQM